jgi:peptide/nickel transport system permease protein
MTAAVASPEEAPAQHRGASAQALHRLLRQRLALSALGVLVAVFIAGALAPDLAPQGWNAIDLSPRWENHGPILSGWHLFGTDSIGRDVLVRTLYGLHTSEQDALLSALLATGIGVAAGVIAGYWGGWADAVVMRIADMLGIFPALMLLLAAYVYFEPVTVAKATLILAAYLWIPVARIIRSSFVAMREAEFVQAARALGASNARIIFRHLLPNMSGTIIIAATTLLGQVIMLEATVEFFGLGVPSQVQPTLGNLIGDAAQAFFQLGAGWWTWAGPSAVLVVILGCANLVGDGADAALNPQTRAR